MFSQQKLRLCEYTSHRFAFQVLKYQGTILVIVYFLCVYINDKVCGPFNIYISTNVTIGWV